MKHRNKMCRSVQFYLYFPKNGGTKYRSTPVLLTQYCAGDKIEKIEMGGTCGTYGGRERCAQGVG